MIGSNRKRKERILAELAGERTYTGLPGKCGHAVRRTENGSCVECARKRDRERHPPSAKWLFFGMWCEELGRAVNWGNFFYWHKRYWW